LQRFKKTLILQQLSLKFKKDVAVYVNKHLSEPYLSDLVQQCSCYLQHERRLTVKRYLAKQKYDNSQSIINLKHLIVWTSKLI